MPPFDPPQNDVSRHDLADRLRLSEQRFREIVDQNPYAVHLVDTEGRTLHVNAAFRRLFGGVEPLPDYSIFEDPMLIASGKREELIAMCRGEAKEAPEFWANPSKSDPLAPDKRFCVRLNAFPLRDPAGEIEAYVIMLEDITARKLAEEALRESEAKNRAFVEAIPDLIFLSTVEGICLDYHSSDPSFLLAPPNAFLGQDILAFLPKETGEQCREAFRQADLTHKVQIVDYSVPMNGKLLDYESRIVSCPPGKILSLVRDVTERTQALKALRESEQRFRAFFLNTSDGILWVSVQEDGYRVEDLNPAAQAQFRVSAAAAKGKDLPAILNPEAVRAFETGFQECLNRGRSYSFTAAMELADGHKDFSILVVPILREEGHRDLVAITRDITQNLRAEEAMRQAQKLESLGVLAGGIAHDFNNLLTAILGNLNLAQLQISPESPALPFIENVEKTILRAAELTKQMLAYSGRGRFIVKPHDLNEVVREMAHLLQVSIPKKVSLHINPGMPLPPIEADGAQLQQIVMNLVTNAADAIGDQEGRIRITTEAKILDEAYIRSHLPAQDLASGAYVMLEVSDTGCGMSKDVLSRIFEPFFTTKASGRGLGLSALQGIIRGHHAGFRVYSEIGRGSVFRVFFPALELPSAQAEPVQPHPTSSLTGLILLVDDETSILETTSTMLEAIGFDVIQAGDGLAGLEQFKEHADRIRLVLLDLTMPRMDGREALQAIRRLDADVPVILSSGYTEQESSKEFSGQRRLSFLQKPYTFKELRTAVQKCLD